MNHFYENIHGWFTYPNLYRRMVARYDNAHFVEVGVWKGRSVCYMAVEIINSRKNIKFDCVDTWEWIEDQQDLPKESYANLYEEFLKNIEPVANSVNPIKMLSQEAVLLYEDKSLDFVFIDAAHDYDNIKKDILAWLPKIKPGGTIAGHDYTYSEGVKRAVDEIFGYVEITEECWVKEVEN